METFMARYLEEYFDIEYNLLNTLLKNKPAWIDVNEACNNALQRGLGACQLAQHCDNGLSSDDAQLLHWKFYKEIGNLRVASQLLL